MAKRQQDFFTVNEQKLRTELKKEIKDYLKTYAYTYTKEAAIELTKVAKSAIEAFYNDYEPNWYHRTYDLKDNSYILYHHNNGRRYYGGVRISAEKMSPYMNGWNSEPTPPEIIVNSAWVHGWHGHTNRGVKPMSPTPLEIVQEKMTDKKFLSELDRKATQAANSMTYKYLPV